jgi:hypothetical protein
LKTNNYISYLEKNAITYNNADVVILNSEAKPTIMSYIVIAVKIYSATSNQVRLKKIVSFTMKDALAYYNAVVVNSKVLGLGPVDDGKQF